MGRFVDYDINTFYVTSVDAKYLSWVNIQDAPLNRSADQIIHVQSHLHVTAIS